MENITIPASTTEPSYKQPLSVRIGAHFFSVLFHPLFIPIYVTAFLLFIHPYAFAGVNERRKLFTLASVAFSTFFLPAFSVFLMRRLGFIQSIMLKTSRERIIPYAAALVFYFWIWYVFHNLPDIPPFFVDFMLGTFLSVCAAWLFNITFKISMHAIGVGGLVMFFLLQIIFGQEATGLYLSIAFLIAGITCTARFIVSDHTQKEIYIGFFVGMFCQLLGYWF